MPATLEIQAEFHVHAGDRYIGAMHTRDQAIDRVRGLSRAEVWRRGELVHSHVTDRRTGVTCTV